MDDFWETLEKHFGRRFCELVWSIPKSREILKKAPVGLRIELYDEAPYPGWFNWDTDTLHLSNRKADTTSFKVATLAHELIHAIQKLEEGKAEPKMHDELVELELPAYRSTFQVLCQAPLSSFKDGSDIERRASLKHRKNYRKYGEKYLRDWVEDMCVLRYASDETKKEAKADLELVKGAK